MCSELEKRLCGRFLHLWVLLGCGHSLKKLLGGLEFSGFPASGWRGSWPDVRDTGGAGRGPSFAGNFPFSGTSNVTSFPFDVRPAKVSELSRNSFSQRWRHWKDHWRKEPAGRDEGAGAHGTRAVFRTLCVQSSCG